MSPRSRCSRCRRRSSRLDRRRRRRQHSCSRKRSGRSVWPLAVEPRRVTAIVLSPAGGGLNGLDVRLDGHATTGCGQGCYRADLDAGRTVGSRSGGSGPTRQTSFVLPQVPARRQRSRRRLRQRYRALTSVRYVERLRSDPTHAITARWLLEKPNRAGIFDFRRRAGDRDRDAPLGPPTPRRSVAGIGTDAAAAAGDAVELRDERPRDRRRRHDEDGLVRRSERFPRTSRCGSTRRRLRPRVLHMTAAAHFMTDRYESFNSPRAIYPPR